MAEVAAGEEDTAVLLSQEQKIKRSKQSQDVEVSKVKMYSMLGTILILFGLLIATNLSDWQVFTSAVEAEREIIKIDSMMEKEVKSGPVNAEAALVAYQVEEAIRAEDDKKMEEKVRKAKDEGSDSAASPPSTTKKKKKKEKKETPAEMSSEEAKIVAEIKTIEKAMAENKQRTGEEKKQRELDRMAVEALERQLRKIRGTTDKYNAGREKLRKEKYKRIVKNHDRAAKPRKIALEPEIQEIVDGFDGSLKPPEYCYKSPKGNDARPKEDQYTNEPSSAGQGGRRSLLRRRRRRRRNRPSTGGERVPPDWAQLPLNVSREILQVAAEKYPCLILHQDCFDETFNKDAAKLRRWYDKSFFAKSKLTWEERLARLEDFKQLRLGTCAVVGNADNVIKGKFGSEIDEHDFVIRYNVITKPYKEAVGTKTDGLLNKLTYGGTKFASKGTPSKFNLFPKYIPNELSPAKLSGGKKALIYGAPFLEAWRKSTVRMSNVYKKAKGIHVKLMAYGKAKPQHSSSGFDVNRAVLELLRLGVCDRLDVYGFSSGGGKYFIPSMKVSPVHPIRAENFVYRLWMATGIHG